MAQLVSWLSDQKPFSMSNPTQIDFVSTRDYRGPRKGRMVIDHVFLVIEGVITVATQAVDARDTAAFVGQISVEQNDGEQRVAPINGVQHRLYTSQVLGPESYPENLGIAIGAAQAVSIAIPISFGTRPFQARGYDWSLGVEMLRKITVTPATLSAAAKGTAVLSAPTLNAYIEFWGHEEMYLEHKILDELSIVDFTSGTQVTAALSGPLLEAWIISTSVSAAAGVGGGGLITAVTDYRIDGLSIPLTPRARMIRNHRLMRHRGNTSSAAVAGEVYADPITEGRMFPLLSPQVDVVAPWDAFTRGPMNLRFDVVPSTAALQLMTRTAKARSRKAWEISCRAFNIDPNAGGARLTGANGQPMEIDDRMGFAPWRIAIPGL